MDNTGCRKKGYIGYEYKKYAQIRAEFLFC